METLIHYLEVAVRTVISFGFAIGFIATIHEFGHYIIAKMCGVRVDEFSLGVGKALWTRKVGDTEYNLRAIPVLAYVRPAGMDPEEEFELGNDPGERSFQAKSFWAKQAILIGGSLFNFLGAIAIVTGVYWLSGPPVTTIRVGAVLEGKAAARTGVKTNDIFVAFDGVPLRDYEDAVEYINARPGKPIRVHINRPRGEALEGNWIDDPALVEVLELEVTPEDVNGDGRGLMGIQVGAIEVPGIEPVRMPFGKALGRAGSRVADNVSQLFRGLIGMFRRMVTRMEVPKEVGGPVQIIHIISKQSAFGLLPILMLTASLSISIGVFNLLPIPALDGGRMLLLLVATLAGWVARLRGVESPEDSMLGNRLEEWIHVVGFLFLIGLLVLVTLKDFWEIFK